MSYIASGFDAVTRHRTAGVGMTGPDMHGKTVDQTLRERFTSAWGQGRPQPIEQFLPAEDDSSYLATLEELVRIELRLAWKAWGKADKQPSTAPQAETVTRPATLATYLKRFPRLDQPEIVLRLIREEFSARKQCGQSPAIEEYRRRFPELAIDDGQLESMLPMVSDWSHDGPLAETQVAGRPGDATADALGPGRFGNYELLEEIGRGGMGIVYRARQRTANRIVALKVIRRDRLESMPRDTQTTALDRFRHEAQAAARLEHENIVTVYEVGDVNGQPFFSMRYVDGRTLAEILREGPIANRRAAGYMEPVARAVHEAHCQGILHRDLKPQNIPVDSKTDRALVADFGLAKLSEGAEELTRAGEVMGTPSYMSPEQAKDSATVTAETDIYSLGATLYHILTGRPPFQAATPVETLRQVIDEEPAPPRQLNPSIDRDLDTICLKCLQKEPARRYATAEALADDLRRYLDGKPILARPIGVVGRTWRWCRRNPAVATLTALAATFLVLALVASTVGYVKTKAALDESEESFRQLGGAVDTFFRDVADETLLNEPGMQPLRKKLLGDARAYYQQFALQRSGDPKIQDELALAHFRVGRINELIDTPQNSLESYEHARKMQGGLLAERPADLKRLEAMGNTLNAIGKVWHEKLRKLEKARAAYEEAIKVRERLAQAAPQDSEFKRKLANMHMNIGNLEKDSGHFDEARRRYNTAQALRRELLDQGGNHAKIRCDLAMGHYGLGFLAMLAAEHADTPEQLEKVRTAAQRDLEDAIAIFQELLAADPGDLENQDLLATCYRTLADLKSKIDPDAARDLYQKTLNQLQALANGSPYVHRYRVDVARLRMVVGYLEFEQNRPQVAFKSFQQAADLLKELVREYPKVPDYRFECAKTLFIVAGLQWQTGEVQQAHANLEIAQGHLSKLVEQFPRNAEYQTSLKQIIDTLDKLNANGS